jgi:putative DNA primase/helicase
MSNDFQQAIFDLVNYSPDNIINDGKFHRFSTREKHNDNAGYYLLMPDNSYGCFGDHRAGIYEVWFPKENNYSDIEKQNYKKLAHEKITEALKEQEEVYKKVAISAQKRWSETTPVIKHNYLSKKQISAEGFNLHNELLIAPLVDTENNIWNLEQIFPDGTKKGLAGGLRKGVFFQIGKITDRLFVCEGIATAKSIYQATGISTIASCGVHNLENVIENIVKKYSNINIIICADDDYKLKDNIGVETSKKVANKFKLKMVYPIFKSESNRGTDFNDLHCIESISTVEKQLKDLFKDNDVLVDEIIEKSNNDIFPSINQRPCYVVIEKWHQINDKKIAPGTYFCNKKIDKEGVPILENINIFPPIWVLAQTRDHENDNFGRKIAFNDSLGNYKEWAMPYELIGEANGEKLRKTLLRMGFNLKPRGFNHLINYIADQDTKKAIFCVTKVGWYNDKTFVLPDRVYGADDVMFQHRGFNNAYTTSGTLEEWQNNVGKYGEKNPFIAFVLSNALTGTILRLCGAEGGGFHMYGESSKGKSTLLRVAASVCGGKEYVRSWKATSNGLEGAASNFNDNLLALDESEQANPNDITAITYMLGNEQGKQRANIHGDARSIANFKCQVLSTGEHPLKTLVESTNKKSKAGQEVRLVDLPIFGKFGIFDDIYDATDSAAFADMLNNNALKYYGTPLRAFIEKLTVSKIDYHKEFQATLAQLEAICKPVEGQEQRVLKRLASVFFTSKLGSYFGIFKWSAEYIRDFIVVLFNKWKETRDGSGNNEKYKVINTVLEYIMKYESRFSPKASIDERPPNERTGWYEDIVENGENTRLYLFRTGGLKEVLKDFNEKTALKYLKECGALKSSAGMNGYVFRANGLLIKGHAIILSKLNFD